MLTDVNEGKSFSVAQEKILRRAFATSDGKMAERIKVSELKEVLRAVDVRRFAVVLRALVLLAAVERRALDVVLFAAVLLELVLFDLPVEDLPRSLRKSDLIRNYSLKCIKALCGKC